MWVCVCVRARARTRLLFFPSVHISLPMCTCMCTCVYTLPPTHTRIFMSDTLSVSDCRSGTIAIQPTGEPPGPPAKLGAMCHGDTMPFFCSAGIVENEQIEVKWSPPEDDGGSPVTGYVVLYGKWDPVMSEKEPNRAYSANLVEVVRAEPLKTSHVITRLVNDVDYVVVVEALNKYGKSPRQMSGRFTPKFCETSEGMVA